MHFCKHRAFYPQKNKAIISFAFEIVSSILILRDELWSVISDRSSVTILLERGLTTETRGHNAKMSLNAS